MTDSSASFLPLALVIEDDERLAQIFTLALRQASFDTQVIGNGQAALEALTHLSPAIVVLDLHLPGVPGGKILQQIRQEPRLAGVQVIIATADPSAADALEDLSDLVLIKPVSFSQLKDLAGRLHMRLTPR